MAVTRRLPDAHATFTRPPGPSRGASWSRTPGDKLDAPRGSTFLILDGWDLEVLTALAWAAPLTTQQVYRLVGPGGSVRALQRRLVAMQHAGLIEGHLYYRKTAGEGVKRIGQVWGVTPLGIGAMEETRRPPQAARLRPAVFGHDLTVSELVVRVLTAARPWLGGVSLAREVRLDPEQPRPRCDAILILRLRLDGGADVLPWTSDPPLPDDRLRGWAIEVDTGTEALSIIREKALRYQAIYTQEVVDRLGRLPLPLWVVPDLNRGNAILKTWFAAWPAGRWLMTTADRLADLAFTEYRAGEQRLHHLLSGLPGVE